jgi:LmbE family N-acetylglucosaminyl deacetylase
MERPEKIMVVAAHPDDIEMSCGGTIAKWISEGSQASFLLVTSGEKGGRRCELTAQQLAAVREEEQLAAAKVLGAEQVEFLRKPDGSLVYSVELRGDVVRWIRKWKPDVVFTHDPTVMFLTWNEVNHKDHRTVGEATLDAMYPFARGRLTYPEQLSDEELTPHAAKGAFLWDTDSPNHYEDITDFLDKRIEAVACHKTQFPKIEPVENWLRQHASDMAEKMEYQYGERFRFIDLRPVF